MGTQWYRSSGDALRHHTRCQVVHDHGMTTSAQMSSIASSLGEIQRRVSRLAEDAHADGDDVVASELFSVERSLLGALRRIGRLTSATVTA